MSWNQVLQRDETKINLHQNDGKRKAGKRKVTAYDRKHNTSFVKHGGGSVMACARMAAKGTGSLMFNDDATADKSNEMNCEVDRAKLCY